MKDYRAIIIILDSVGIGELPDADKYGDTGSNTLCNLADAVGGLSLPNMEKLGLGNIADIKGIAPAPHPSGSYGKMAEQSAGKDTTTGHWELMGIVNTTPFPIYPNGFPNKIINAFKKAVGTEILGNIPASGTEIISRLGEEHMKTGFPIVYTSADSVFQIAAHEEIIPVDKLYNMCEEARKILVYPNNAARVIARPFCGTPGSFERTRKRKDFSIRPPFPTLLDYAAETFAIGKISDIFAGQGIKDSIHTNNNLEGIQKTIWAIKEKKDYKIIFTNLIDFDMVYGHRNNVPGYYNSLKEFDNNIPGILKVLRKNDILIITADHGCDPTTPSTDHSREYVPLLVYGQEIKPGINLGIRSSFSDVAQTLAELFGLPKMPNGVSFLGQIMASK